ncbi:MAG: Lrp/AsnC ligand binding domain-containing protein [Candidatus Woesearchaeota archaeon]
MIAYVLISLHDGDERKLMDDLEDLPEVREVHILFGEWDLIVKLTVENAEDLAKFVMERIRTRKEIRVTSTMIAAK